MVELLGSWLMGVTCAAMILALAEGLSPAGGPKRAARLLHGLAVELLALPELQSDLGKMPVRFLPQAEAFATVSVSPQEWRFGITTP